MSQPILILAGDMREAREIARRFELAPRDWVYIGNDYALRGRREPQVIATDCWSWRKANWREGEDIYRSLRWSLARVATVSCRT